MVLIPCILLAAFPPGLLFPQMAARMSANKRDRKREAGETRDQTQSSSKSGIVEDNDRNLEKERDVENRGGFAKV